MKKIEKEKIEITVKYCKICIKNMIKLAFTQVSFLQFFVVFYKKYIFFTVGSFKCKNYSEITVETRTQLKSIIFTTDIFAVQIVWLYWLQDRDSMPNCYTINHPATLHMQ